MKTKISLLFVLILSIALIIGCTPTPPSSPEAVEDLPPVPQLKPADEPLADDVAAVKINNFAFEPATVEIATGDSVEWANVDSASHTVTFDNGVFDQNLPNGGTARNTFTEPGEYSYHCSFHPGMRGVVIVQ